jgi:hypothetical protein
VPSNLASLTLNRRIFLGSAVLLVINSFLPWYHVSAGPFSASLSGWHQIGVVAWLLVIALLVYEGARATNFVPVKGRTADLYSSLIALSAVVVGAIYVLIRLGDGGLGFAVFLGIVLLAGLGYTAVASFRENGGADAVKAELDARRK